ncbi:ABC transporter permease [Virgibacillus sp. MSJ-26]|uniref:ABC transporter permease n=1 Tax=Virgibacillus sp. MSJ-26 TaxID=2841522 RepID=UPI001C11DFAB|nr:ABC transporter permease [Virgibacillus sp. MSJ-26]MBU5468355.1 ABC transporter permease [Virgibacillus sp. MSJ-26]
MFNSHTFYKKRLSEHLKETSRYLRYMLNEHISIAMLFLISALAFYYQQWLAQLPENFPTALIIGIAFGLVVSYSPVRTLLKEPDLVFLIVAEDKMSAYFRNTLIYSFVIQLYIVFIVAAALGPLYLATYPERSGKMYLYTIVALLIFKAWNLLANWWMLKVRDDSLRHVDLALRVSLNCAAFYFFVSGDGLLAGIMTVLFVIIFLYDYQLSQKQLGIAWELLVEKDRNRMQAFYRLANMFTDVPHLRNPVKKRTWLVSLVKNVPFAKQYTYDYLYRITFIRSGDYLGMYIRLMIIGGLVIFYIPNLVMKLLFALLFLYMSSFQMVTLFHHHRTVMWLDIYPVEYSVRKQALLKWLTQLGFIQAVLFALIFVILKLYLGALIALVGGILFVYVFVNGYVSRKLV